MIFDEATSALDPESEAEIQGNINTIGRGRTMIIVSHRLSMLRHADQILVLDGGRLVGAGAHEDVYANCPIYRSLWDRQNAVQQGHCESFHPSFAAARARHRPCARPFPSRAAVALPLPVTESAVQAQQPSEQQEQQKPEQKAQEQQPPQPREVPRDILRFQPDRVLLERATPPLGARWTLFTLAGVLCVLILWPLWAKSTKSFPPRAKSSPWPRPWCSSPTASRLSRISAWSWGSVCTKATCW